MKALILANTNEYHFINGNYIPTCFLPVHGELTIIQRILCLLSVSGFSPEDIIVCFGTGAAWDSNAVMKEVENIKVRKAFATPGYLNKSIIDTDLFNEEDLLVVSGTDVIDLSIITRLLRYKEKNVIVVRDLLSPDDAKKLSHRMMLKS